MDFQLNEDQAALVAAVQSILRDHDEVPQSERTSYSFFDAQLQRQLTDGGFLDAARDLGPLEAALVVFEVARVPAVVETGASALVVPALFPEERVVGPVALVPGDALGKAHRNLTIARTALVDLGADAGVISVAPGDVAPVESIFAYPYGRFVSPPNPAQIRRLPGAGPLLRQWWRVALAAEAAGAAQAAIAFTIDYVKQRQVFGRSVGSFQAVHHRLAQCHQIASGIQYLALRAAWSGQSQDADIAACYAQQHVQKLIFDLHQFNGAMGVTNEHLLHFWTYRLRALQAEVGGAHKAALDIARARGEQAPPSAVAHDAPHTLVSGCV
ncbi:acyl-CoA dehydrogenase family protein [Xanthobacter flavus]|uniref:acyl-CoA dehydrogenase family protein n=1 Tax=Xanthobacter flavus TaxID=281 RepID=UPI00372CD63D